MPTIGISPSPATRFVALDVHRHSLIVGAVDLQQQVVLSPRRFGFAAFAAWAQVHFTHADAVVLEATTNAWLLYDQVQPLVAEGVVAHPQAVKLIAAARVKTDSRDTSKLASLLAAHLIPAVWVPPREVFKLLQLVSREGLAGMEVVEVSPPYDVADVTALLASRVIMDVLGILVLNRKLGRVPPVHAGGQQQTNG